MCILRMAKASWIEVSRSPNELSSPKNRAIGPEGKIQTRSYDFGSNPLSPWKLNSLIFLCLHLGGTQIASIPIRRRQKQREVNL